MSEELAEVSTPTTDFTSSPPPSFHTRVSFFQRTIIKVNRILLRRVFYSPRFGGAMCESSNQLQGLPHKIYWINTILSCVSSASFYAVLTRQIFTHRQMVYVREDRK